MNYFSDGRCFSCKGLCVPLFLLQGNKSGGITLSYILMNEADSFFNLTSEVNLLNF